MNDLKTAFSLCDENKEVKDELDFRSIEERAKSFVGYEVFSTPGHKGELDTLDITEYDEDRLFPGEQLKKAEEKVAEHYKVKRLRFSVVGSSLAVKASVLALDGDIVAPSFSHRCLKEGLVLAKRKGYFFDTEQVDGLPAVATVKDYIKALESSEGVKGLFVTSPDYFGRVADIEGIRALCNERGLALIVDCAHGAHFASRADIFPVGAESVADFACLSAHKTLRALTQSAFGVCNDERYFASWERAFTLLGTSSPSYRLLASLENAIEYEKSMASKYDKLVQAVAKIKSELPCLENADPLRIVVRSENAERLYAQMVERKIMPETYCGKYCIFIVTLSDEPSKVEKLYLALKELL